MAVMCGLIPGSLPQSVGHPLFSCQCQAAAITVRLSLEASSFVLLVQGCLDYLGPFVILYKTGFFCKFPCRILLVF